MQPRTVFLALAIGITPANALQAQASRRSLLRAAAGAALLPLVPRHASAEYGEGAKQAAPAFVPSPFKPTGAMADTCEVVALGREDVCLEPKKLLSAYDAMQLDKARASLNELTGRAPAGARPFVAAACAIIGHVGRLDWSALDGALAALPAGDSNMPALGVLQAAEAALGAASKRRDGPGAAKLALKLAAELDAAL